ncbi:hypothetical protein [Bradyrhizobium sp. 25ACV]
MHHNVPPIRLSDSCDEIPVQLSTDIAALQALVAVARAERDHALSQIDRLRTSCISCNAPSSAGEARSGATAAGDRG